MLCRFWASTANGCLSNGCAVVPQSPSDFSLLLPIWRTSEMSLRLHQKCYTGNSISLNHSKILLLFFFFFLPQLFNRTSSFSYVVNIDTIWKYNPLVIQVNEWIAVFFSQSFMLCSLFAQCSEPILHSIIRPEVFPKKKKNNIRWQLQSVITKHRKATQKT